MAPTRLFFLLCFFSASSLSFSFIFPQEAVNPALYRYAKAQQGTVLDIRLDVISNTDSRLSITGMLLELFQNPCKDEHVPMPGANGPHPKLSTGPLQIQVLEEGKYVTMKGSQNLKLLEGAWEMVWKDGAPAGSIVCGFFISEEAKRNDATLPSCRMYMNFPVWTREDLMEQQAKKFSAQELLSKHKKEYKEEWSKMKDTSNPLQKALHFRNAAALSEKISLTSRYDSVPNDNDIVPIGDDLLLCTKATVWTKDKMSFGSEHTLLGYATARLNSNII